MITMPLIDESQLFELMQSTWTSMIGLPISTDPLAPDELLYQSITAFVPIAGAWRGFVVFQPSMVAAARAAAAIMRVAPADLQPADIQETVAEICNILGGGIKSLLPDPSSLALPLVMQGASHETRLPMTRLLLRTRYLADGEPINVSIFEAIEPALEAPCQR